MLPADENPPAGEEEANTPRGWHTTRPAPLWWPEGEPWPPPRRWRGGRWHPMRRRFLRRGGCAFFLLVLIVGGLFTALFWLLGSSLRLLAVPGSAQTVLALAALALVIVGLAGVALAGMAVRRTVLPFGDLLDAAGRISDGDYATRVPEHGPREMRGLAQAFNSMAGKLESTDRQRRALLADVTHELRTPITVIQGNLEGMLDGIYPADPPHLQSLLEETRLLSRIIDDLRTLSMAETGALRLQREATDLALLARETVDAFRPQARERSVVLEAEGEAELPTVEVDPARIREVLANLLSNALRYTPPGGAVRVRVEVAAGVQRISVQDDGPGISPSDLPYIFDRFYKSADSGGSGLGLAIAKSLVAAHGGEIRAESVPGKGTTITFTLPGEGK